MTAIEGEARTPAPGVLDRRRRPADLARRRRRRARADWFVAPDGLLLMAVEGAGRRQPAGRGAQPGARAAARRRPGAQVRGLAAHRQRPPRHHRRRLGGPGGGRAGAAVAARLRAGHRRSRRTCSTACWPSSSRSFLWSGATAAIARARIRQPAAAAWWRATWPGVPSPSPATCRSPRPYAGRRSRRRQHRHGDRRAASRSGSSARRPWLRPRRSGGPGSPPRRWPAPWTTGCACRWRSAARS